MVKRALLAVFLILSFGAVARTQNYSVPAGTTFHCRLTQTLSTKVNFQGDMFTATVAEPFVVDHQDVIPVGATIEGRISRMARSGRMRGAGEMRLAAEKISFPDGRSYPLNAVLVTAYGAQGARVVGAEGTVKGPNSRTRDLEEIGIGMGGGGFLGTIFGGFHGAVIGGTVGGVAGFLDTLRRRGKELTLPSGTELKYQLTRELVIQR